MFKPVSELCRHEFNFVSITFIVRAIVLNEAIIYTRWLWRDSSGAGSSQPEFTASAVLIGLAIGCLVCFTNLSLGLQSGWISM